MQYKIETIFNKQKQLNKAFTLAEIMIVLIVLGVLTAILLPAAFKANPDENVLKFRKGNATFSNAIKILSDSEEYFLAGDLSRRGDGASINTTYFCEAFADSVSYKSKRCGGTAYDGAYMYVDISSNPKANLDSYCAAATQSDNVVITSDKITYYEASPATPFSTSKISNLFRGNHKDSNGFNRIYKVFCVDVDGIGKGEAPFGYGVRIDGRILPSNRVDQWMEKNIQNN